MWIKSQSNVLINLKMVETIYVEGASVICTAHRINNVTPYKRVIGIFNSAEDAQIMLKIITGFLIDGSENLLLVPSNDKLSKYREVDA